MKVLTIDVGGTSIRNEKVKILKSIPPLTEQDLVRSQFRGYLDEPGVKPHSQVETFGAMRLYVNAWRWKGVPFYIRADKNLQLLGVSRRLAQSSGAS